ncbi:hypothetical protein [Ruegeria arenilitoris]|uniref:hypothetical protein n=1 Tax=Ruegeria arenilitoris TaxID=1173585 RepID=UPI00147F4C1A|nr:hypothetical protein [Ruegeria arenilitoris]
MYIEPLQRPAVQTYLSEIQSDPVFEELFLTDRDEFVGLDTNPKGWDWADHYGSRIIDGHWLEASEPDEQLRLARICHLRALAWEAAIQHIMRAS